MTIDHDMLYKELIVNFFKEFMEGFFPEESKYIDYNYLEFLKQEDFLDREPDKEKRKTKRSQVVDILIKTRLLGEEGFILVHVEPQSQKQEDFNHRMFKYFCRLYSSYELRILPVAILAHDIKKDEPDNYKIEFPFLQVVDYNFLQLHLKKYYWREFIRQDNPAVAALLSKMDYGEKEKVQLKTEFFRMITNLELDREKMKLLVTFMETYVILTSEEEEQVRENIKRELPNREVKRLEELMTSWEKKGMEKGMEKGIEKGMEKGMEKGIEKGELNALKTVIIKQAKQKFGSIDDSTETKVNDLNKKEKLEEVASKLINMESEKELLQILEE